MSNLIDLLTDYFDRKGDTFGQWYTRCLIGLLFMGVVTGVLAGFTTVLFLSSLRYMWVQP